MTTTTNNNPVAAIAVRNGHTKDQLPKYGYAYYLKDGQEFILMLYNPTKRKVAAKIFINGRAESSMLVLKPGQRAWIERFIDTNRKLLFETYEIDDTPEGREAVSDNGKVRVEFYYEAAPQQRIVFIEKPIYVEHPVYIPFTPYPQPPWSTPGIYYNNNVDASHVINGSAHVTLDQISFCYNSTNESAKCQFDANVQQMETGRVEMGQKSDQEFGASHDSFEYSYFHVEEFRLMPEKYMPAEKVKTYCVKCGRAQKSGDVYCTQCGNKY